MTGTTALPDACDRTTRPSCMGDDEKQPERRRGVARAAYASCATDAAVGTALDDAAIALAAAEMREKRPATMRVLGWL
jgi:hypothetical protein